MENSKSAKSDHVSIRGLMDAAAKRMKGMKLITDPGSQSCSPVEEITCSWCAEAVPMPAGDHSGVCIRCGTVMFRGLRGGLPGSFDEIDSLSMAESERVVVSAARS